MAIGTRPTICMPGSRDAHVMEEQAITMLSDRLNAIAGDGTTRLFAGWCSRTLQEVLVPLRRVARPSSCHRWRKCPLANG